MVNDWPVHSIAECASQEPYSTQIGPFGKALMAQEYTISGVPVLRGVNVNHGRFHDSDFVFISEGKADQLSKFESYPNDVLLVHKGTLGKIGLLPAMRKYPRYILGNSMMRVRCDPMKLLPEYLYYWLSSPDGQHYLFSRISQVGVPQLQTPLTTLRQATLPVPPLPIQRGIVDILGKLDDKVELNERMNESLEGVMKAMFKDWFLNFEFPNEQGRSYKSSGGEMTYSEGLEKEIPRGWKIGFLGDVADNPRRGIQPEVVEEGTPYIGLEHMPRRSIALAEWGTTEEVTSHKFQFYEGEVLFGKLRPYFHKVGVTAVSGVCSTDILIVVPKSPEWYSFVLSQVSSDEFVSFVSAASTGTRMPRTNWEDMA
jgi:type I restriction enzyme S subunit